MIIGIILSILFLLMRFLNHTVYNTALQMNSCFFWQVSSMNFLFSLFRDDMPSEHRSNFIHLYLDIGWYGVLSGSAIAFLSVYLVRIGATSFQIGLVSAIPAFLSLILALPAGGWLSTRRVDKPVVWSAIVFRVFYIFWVPIPSLFVAEIQIWLYIALTFLMSIPLTLLGIGFNAFFAEAVPDQWRASVVGVRNAILAFTFIITTLICGFLLDNLPFPLGYQLVFGIGVLGAVMSTVHLVLVKLPGSSGGFGLKGSSSLVLRALRQFRLKLPAPDYKILQGHFGLVLLSMFSFHLTQYLPISLFPIFWVEKLNLTDQVISLSNALFYVTVFLGSTQLDRLTRRFGNFRLTAAGAVLLAAYPGFTALAVDYKLIMVAAVTGGFAWALMGGAQLNYLLEVIPVNQRPAYLAWYTVALQAAILAGSLLGPVIGRGIGLVPAMALFTFGRVFSGLVIYWLGRPSQKPRAV